MSNASVIKSLLKQSKQQGLDAEGPTPLYHQLYKLLKEAIIDGTVSYGAQMPTEQQLAEAFGLSRITAKRAMDELAAEQLVERKRGRGTNVTYKYKPKPVQAPLVGMLESLESMGRHTLIKVLDIAELIPPADIRQEFALGDTETAHRLLRVRSTEDEKLPFAYYTSWTVGLKNGFTRKLLEQTTRFEILRKSGIQIAKIEQTLSAEAAKPEVARELDMRAGDPLLVLVRRSYDGDGRLVDVLHGLYNPQVFQYRMSMALDDNGTTKVAPKAAPKKQ